MAQEMTSVAPNDFWVEFYCVDVNASGIDTKKVVGATDVHSASRRPLDGQISVGII
jgi:hypothetical protein